MITAEQAKELAQTEADQDLAEDVGRELDRAIRAAAERGKRRVDVPAPVGGGQRRTEAWVRAATAALDAAGFQHQVVGHYGLSRVRVRW